MKKLKKNVIRAPYFWEKRRFFFQNIWMRATCFLEIGRFFGQIWTREQVFFRDKSWKQGILLTFFAHTIYSSLNRSDVFWTDYGHDDRGFSWKVENMIWEHKSKVDRTVFIHKKQNILIMGVNEEKLVRHTYVRKTWSTFYDFFKKGVLLFLKSNGRKK